MGDADAVYALVPLLRTAHARQGACHLLHTLSSDFMGCCTLVRAGAVPPLAAIVRSSRDEEQANAVGILAMVCSQMDQLQVCVMRSVEEWAARLASGRLGG